MSVPQSAGTVPVYCRFCIGTAPESASIVPNRACTVPQLTCFVSQRAATYCPQGGSLAD